MREILFRGMRLDTGEWVEGFFSSETFYGHIPNDDRVFIIQKGTGFYCPVAPATVGQFIDREDLHGSRIFEGDIVDHGRGRFVVRYIKSISRFAGTKPGISFAGFSFENSVKVGNIHDNPELMEGDTDV